MSEFDVEVLLPVHNEGKTIEATVRAIHAELYSLVNVGFVICEDGSSDNSKPVLRRLAAELPIRLSLSDGRKGYSTAMREAMTMSEAEFALCMDSDGQCDPKDFARFWEQRENADVLIGWRTNRADNFVRRMFSRLFFVLYQLAFHVPVHDPSCPYVMVRRKVAKTLAGELGEMQEGFWWEFVARAYRRGFTIRELPIRHRARAGGATQVYKWWRMPGIFFRHVAAIFKIWKDTEATV